MISFQLNDGENDRVEVEAEQHYDAAATEPPLKPIELKQGNIGHEPSQC
jgi:hypothetical protein